MQQKEYSTPGNCTTVVIQGRSYVTRTVPVTGDSLNKSVEVPENCNGWVVENYGTVRAWVNDKPLLPAPGAGLSGESWGPVGNPGDCYKGFITIRFDAGGVQQVYISFYIYLV